MERVGIGRLWLFLCSVIEERLVHVLLVKDIVHYCDGYVLDLCDAQIHRLLVALGASGISELANALARLGQFCEFVLHRKIALARMAFNKCERICHRLQTASRYTNPICNRSNVIAVRQIPKAHPIQDRIGSKSPNCVRKKQNSR